MPPSHATRPAFGRHDLVEYDIPLAGSCNLVFTQQLDEFYTLNPASSVAIDADSNVIVSTNSTSEAFGPYALPRLFKLAASTGAQIFTYESESARGYGLGVAANACGDIYWATGRTLSTRTCSCRSSRRFA